MMNWGCLWKTLQLLKLNKEFYSFIHVDFLVIYMYCTFKQNLLIIIIIIGGFTLVLLLSELLKHNSNITFQILSCWAVFQFHSSRLFGCEKQRKHAASRFAFHVSFSIFVFSLCFWAAGVKCERWLYLYTRSCLLFAQAADQSPSVAGNLGHVGDRLHLLWIPDAHLRNETGHMLVTCQRRLI